MSRFLIGFLAAGLISTASIAISAEKEKVGERVIVANILDVTYKIQTSEPPNLVVTAIGEVPTGGYSEVLLNRVVYATPPKDGIQDYFLSAVKPSGVVTQVVSKVSASDTLKAYTKEATWLKGIRVHGVGEGVKVIMLD